VVGAGIGSLVGLLVSFLYSSGGLGCEFDYNALHNVLDRVET
jgi:hypothetical protein